VFVLGGQCVRHQASDTILNAIFDRTLAAPQACFDNANRTVAHIGGDEQRAGIPGARQQVQEIAGELCRKGLGRGHTDLKLRQYFLLKHSKLNDS